MAKGPGDSRKREHIRRRTRRLDSHFSFGTRAPSEQTFVPSYGRSEAEFEISKLLGSLKNLPSLVQEAGRPAGPEEQGLGRAIDEDQDLAAMVLRACGAGFFARRGEAPRNILKAVDVLGTAAFRNVTFVATFWRLWPGALPWYGYPEHGLWRHLVGTGVAAWKIGRVMGLHRIASESLFFAGLLHDIGKPAMGGLLKEAPPAAVASENGILTVLESERRSVSMTHPELVHLILDIWGVEHDIFPVAEHHHAPQRAGGKAVQASIVALADVLANEAAVGLDGTYPFGGLSIEKASARVGLDTGKCSLITSELGWLVSEIAAELEQAEG